MGGCATKPATKLQGTEADAKEEEAGEVMEVVKKVVEVQTKEIESGRKSLSLLFIENKKENMEDDTKEPAEFEVAVEQKPPQIIEEELGQNQKNPAPVISVTT